MYLSFLIGLALGVAVVMVIYMRMKDSFKAISYDALSKNSEEFLKRADKQFENQDWPYPHDIHSDTPKPFLVMHSFSVEPNPFQHVGDREYILEISIRLMTPLTLPIYFFFVQSICFRRKAGTSKSSFDRR